MTCPSCGSENRPEARFCLGCGTSLARACPNGHPVPAGARFCDECGAPVEGAEPSTTVAPAGPAAERRLVSVLFADLVGFTAASEDRDAEETRELLSRYFDTCRQLIERYGGTVEKFIGDAVMAVWGTPVAQEDDAERAVRTALDLVAAIPEIDPSLHARAGVLTGEAAVTLGAQGQGMVAGDLVNTASRIQSAAEPGTVLVGEATRRATEAAIAYVDAGAQQLKGKDDPVTTYRALRVTAGRGGAIKQAGLEPPFVGRDRELRLVKELFHGSAEERKAHLVSFLGIAGIGKSRLAWEFEKYIDGLVEEVWWHRGRCLAYGEGVAYWALAEMVRMRATIGEEEPVEESVPKLRACLELHVPDGEERAWLEPRLAHLLGLGEHGAADRQDLFSAWRLFFERLADQGPCVLVFEDLQWAEPGLLDFVEHLLEWSRNHPVFVVALARPELTDRRGGLGAASRNSTTLSLEPLAPEAMEALLDGFVPGLPPELRAGILERAEGVPLYAVETVRMLLDRGLLARAGDAYRPTGPIEALEVPETLHALLAARLDGLSADERQLIQDASVLGKTFSKQGLVAVSGRQADEVEELLAGLIRKEVLSLQADPRSPERGQYGFLQDLLKRVAYETLSKRECKARHLAAAAHLATAWADEQEIVEVVASHYLDAYRLLPEAEDAAEIKGRAREALARAGERAAALAATVEAAKVFAQAAELADDGVEEARLRERAGQSAQQGGDQTEARSQLRQALALYEQEGLDREAARTSASLGRVDWQLHEPEQAIGRMERAFTVLVGEEPDEGFAALAAELGRLHFFLGDLNRAYDRCEVALDAAEQLWIPETLSQALNTMGLIVSARGRWEQGIALIKHSLELALENDLPGPALRAYNNIADLLDRRDRYEEALALHKDGIALARKTGDRTQEWRLLSEHGFCLLRIGDWARARAVLEAIPARESAKGSEVFSLLELDLLQGDGPAARARLASVEFARDAADVQDRSGYELAEASVLAAEGSHERALAAAERAIETATSYSRGAMVTIAKLAMVEALRAAFALGRHERVREVLGEIEAMKQGAQPPMLRAHAARYRALLGEEPEQRFKTSAAIFREYRMVYEAAVVQVEHAEWLGGGGEADRLRAEAREVFERLGATSWLERAGGAGLAVAASGTR
jgi:class 3 adenylate cyclase/tetratricopeptide (TPR) repeat protein